jgi:hypothetical protein
MIFQQPPARVCSCSQSPEASFRVAQSEAESARLTEALRHRKFGVAPGLIGQRFLITRERAWSSLLTMPTTKTAALLTQN